MNRWNIPDLLETEIIERDKCCVYCGVVFGLAGASKGRLPTWEHIVNDARIITRENIARCCCSCNASKGAKLLSIWLESAYCKRRSISLETVAEVVKVAFMTPTQRDEPTALPMKAHPILICHLDRRRRTLSLAKGTEAEWRDPKNKLRCRC